MKASFLGHGLDKGEKNNVGKQLVASFESKKYQEFYGYVAFASISGVKMLESYIKKAKEKYQKIRFYIGVDNRGTSKEALESLLKQNIETYIYHDERDNVTYHPKLYLFEGKVFSRIIIGSSNLTSSGIKTNIESSVQLDFRTKTDKQGKNFLNEIKEYYKDLFNLTSPSLKLLNSNLLDELINKNLLFNQFKEQGEVIEIKNTDGENKEKNNLKFQLNEFDLDSGFEQSHITSEGSNKLYFSENDKVKFDTILERYLIYKSKVRPSGIVSKHTEDRELFYWYSKMNRLFSQDNNSLPFEIFEKLLEADFPFGGIGRERKRLIKWKRDFDKVLEYKQEFDPNSNYTYIPQIKDKSNPYYEIGRWCAWQKQRRKGNKNYGSKWTKYEEDKMSSINFIWDVSKIERRSASERWMENLVDLEKYYSKKKNYKTVPSQSTHLGHWLSDQISLRMRQIRENRTDLIRPIKVKILGELLLKNGVEWEWRKQKEREGIENKIESWRIIEKLKKEGKTNEFRVKYPELLKKYRDDVAQLRSHTKRWNNDKNKWKYELVDKVGFPYNKE